METKGSKPAYGKDFFFAEAKKKNVKVNKINKYIIKGSTDGTGKRK